MVSRIKILFIACSVLLSSALVGYTAKQCDALLQNGAFAATAPSRIFTLDQVFFTTGQFTFRFILQTENNEEFVGEILDSSSMSAPQGIIFCIPGDYTVKYALYYEVLSMQSPGAVMLALHMEGTSFYESFNVGMSSLGCRTTEMERKQFLRTFTVP